MTQSQASEAVVRVVERQPATSRQRVRFVSTFELIVSATGRIRAFDRSRDEVAVAVTGIASTFIVIGSDACLSAGNLPLKKSKLRFIILNTK